MRVPPKGKRAAYLSVAEPPALNVAVVLYRPANTCPTQSDRHRDAPTVADAALVLFDAHQRCGRQSRERSRLLVPAEHLGRWCTDDRGIREPGKACWRSVPNSVLRDPPQQAAEYGRVERQHPVPIESARNPFRIECCRLADQRTRATVERVDPELPPPTARAAPACRQAQP